MISQDWQKFMNQHCVSIYVPTYRAGEEVDQKQGQLLLKKTA